MLELLQNTLIWVGSFVAVLSLVVFVHEFGHFQAAKWRGVAIDTFSIGFGKTLASWKDKQNVTWRIAALPLGGYVKFTDDADAISSAPETRIDDPVAKAEARARGLFHAQSLTTRAIVVAAGPVSNFIFSIAVFAVVAFLVGRDVARVDSVIANSPAAAAGLQVGDVVTAVNGAAIREFTDLQSLVAASPGRTLALDVRRGDDELAVTITPRVNETTRAGMIGVGHETTLDGFEPIGPLAALGEGVRMTWHVVDQTLDYLGKVFSGKESGNQIAGPIGIFTQSGQVAQSALTAPNHDLDDRLGLLAHNLAMMAALLSVAVGFVNLLPIPILDGGHLLFYAVEALRGGRPLPPVAQEWAFRAGLAVMASLFLFATWNDISRLVPGLQG
jgi:regulator of sigma E protease